MTPSLATAAASMAECRGVILNWSPRPHACMARSYLVVSFDGEVLCFTGIDIFTFLDASFMPRSKAEPNPNLLQNSDSLGPPSAKPMKAAPMLHDSAMACSMLFTLPCFAQHQKGLPLNTVEPLHLTGKTSLSLILDSIKPAMVMSLAMEPGS